MKIQLYKVDYKDKYFTYQDEPDYMCSYAPYTLDTEYFVLLAQHVDKCKYYGIPCYNGENEKLNKIFDLLEQAYELANGI